MGIHNNTPTFTWISIKGLNIQKGDKIYSVQDIKTNLEHLYWELDNPYVLRPSGENLGTSGNRYLLYRNNAGEVVEVPNDDLQITYNDPNNNIAFEEKISVISEKSKENGKKMVAIEQDINGVKQTVGNWNVEKNGTITENLTQIKQTNKELDFKVQQTEKSFNEDKFIEKLRENFSKAIIDFNGQLGIMDAQFYGYFKDNIISDEEKLNIESLLGLLGNKKSEVILQTNELIKLAEVQGQTTQKNALISERDKFSDMMDNLNQYVKTAITDGIMSTSDITGVTNLISKCSTSITSLKNTADDFLFLGSGGKIIDELARIGVKSNEILLSVSNTEELIKNTLGVEKNLLQGHITDFQNANADLKYQVDIYSQDGKATDEEKESLNESINKLNKERNDISHKFDELYNNKYLTVKSKNELKTEYDKFINKSNETNIKIIQYFGDGFINDIEKNEIDTLLNESVSFLLSLNTKMCQAIDEIDDETKKAELQAAKDEVKKEISDVTGDVEKLGNYVDGTFKNNVIDDNERRILKQTLSNLETEKIDIDNTYNQLDTSVYLDGLMKTEFQNTYQDLNSKYVELKKTIDDVLNKQILIDELDRNNVNSVKNVFNISLGNFTRLTNKVIEYIGDKQVAKVSKDFNQELNNLNKKMDGMQQDIKNATLDGVLDESEKISLRNNIQLLENEFSKNESEFLKIYKNPNLIGDIKTQLQSTYNDYTLKYGVLISFIEDLINKKDEIIEQDRTNLDTNYTNYRDVIKLYSEKVYEALDSIKNKGIEDMETQFNKDIGDVSKAVVKLENNMNTVFKDGVLSDSEKIGLKQSLQSIQKDKIDVDNGYNSLHSNEYLIDNAKTNLENAYNDYISKYTGLVNVTNTIINKTGIVDTSDQQKFKDTYSNFINASGMYAKRVNESLDAIAKRKADLAEKNSRTYTDSKIKVLNDEISLRVSKKEYDANNIKLNEKLSEINQTSELITLKVNDIQNDYVTSTTLEQTSNEIRSKVDAEGAVSAVTQRAGQIISEFSEHGEVQVRNGNFSIANSHGERMLWTNGGRIATSGIDVYGDNDGTLNIFGNGNKGIELRSYNDEDVYIDLSRNQFEDYHSRILLTRNHLDLLTQFSAAQYEFTGRNGGITYFNVNGNFAVSGSKSRIVKTENYGDRCLNAVESADCYFVDIGESRTINGECTIVIDKVFKETVNTEIDYQVFISKYGKGDIWVEERHPDYFIVKSENDISFAWEIKAKQKGFENKRLQMQEFEMLVSNKEGWKIYRK